MKKICYTICFIFFVSSLTIRVYPNSVDSLLSVKNLTKKEDQLKFLMEFCFDNRHTSPHTALEAGLTAYNISDTTGDHRSKAQSANLVSVIYRSFGDYEKALNYNIRAIKLAITIKDSLTFAYAKNNLGHIYRVKKFYDKAMNEAQSSYNIFQILKNDEGIAFSGINLGYIYLELGEFDKAISYIEKAIEIRKRLGDTEGESVARFALADAYLGLREYQKGLDIYQSLLESYKAKSFRSISFASINAAIANLYLQKNELHKAASYFEIASNESRKLGNKKDQVVYVSHLVQIYTKINNDRKVSEKITTLGSLIIGFTEWVPLAQALKVMHRYYFEKGDVEKAFYYSRELNDANDSITFQVKRESIESMSLVFENFTPFSETQRVKNNDTGMIAYNWYEILLIFLLLAVMTFLILKTRKYKVANSHKHI